MRDGRIRNLLKRLYTGLTAVLLFCMYPACFAHPMGNFSISHYAEIMLERDRVEVRYIIDLAEIPTFQEIQQHGITAAANDSDLKKYLQIKAKELSGGLQLTVNGKSVALDAESMKAIFPVGAGGLPTLKIGIVYRANVSQDCAEQACKLHYEDRNFEGRAGWKEIVIVAGQNVKVGSSTAPDHDRSAQLTNYPTDLINSPPQSLSAQAEFIDVAPVAKMMSSGTVTKPGLAHKTPKAEKGHAIYAGPTMQTSSSPLPGKDAKGTFEVGANVQGTPRSAFTELIAAPRVSLGIAFLAALISAGLGALHALEPGHGKTIVAAYLVGAKGTAKHALLLGSIVTATHTAGVYLLGAVTLYAQRYIVPEKLYPIFGVLSGILIVGMGSYLLLQRLVGADLLHVHEDGQASHRHFGFAHSHLPGGADFNLSTEATKNKAVPLRQLVVLGITGGIVPCPAALVVLLSALSLNRMVFGMLLIVAFSIGLAAVLIAMGMIAVHAGRWMSTMRVNSPLIQRWLPLTSAAMITVLGCAIAVRSLFAAGILPVHI